MFLKPAALFSAVLTALLIAFTAYAYESAMAPLDSLWKSASDPALAWEQRRRLYEEWNAVATSYGVTSASAFTNLAYGSWESGDLPGTVRNLMEAAKRSSSLSDTWQFLGDMHRVEQRLGNKDQLSGNWNFRLFVLSGPNFRLLLLLSIAWGAVLGLIFRKRFPLPPVARAGFWIGLSGLSVFTAYVHFNHKFFPGIGMLESESGRIETFLDQDPEKPLVKLPAGTLVRVLGKNSENTQIDFPVAAWVRSADITALVAAKR